MKLTDILKKNFYSDSIIYTDYEEIIDILSKDIITDEIIGYEIVDLDETSKKIKLATADGNIKELEYNININNKVSSISISDKNTKITISNNPFSIKGLSNHESYIKNVSIKKIHYYYTITSNNKKIEKIEEDKINLEINISSHFSTKTNDTIDSHTTYTTGLDNIERIVDIIESTTEIVSESPKQKALKK